MKISSIDFSIVGSFVTIVGPFEVGSCVTTIGIIGTISCVAAPISPLELCYSC
jgi:hypothetical protein